MDTLWIPEVKLCAVCSSKSSKEWSREVYGHFYFSWFQLVRGKLQQFTQNPLMNKIGVKLWSNEDETGLD